MRRTRCLALLVAAFALTGCATTVADAPTGPGSTSASEGGARNGLHGELTIYAASSLRTPFDAMAEEFERLHPGVDILPIVYDGSSTLVTQLSEGAAADVFASADEKNMALAAEAALLADPAVLFATNTLVLAVPEANRAGVTELEDLADPAVATVLCAPEVPCGGASAHLLEAAGVTLTPVSLEQNVTAVLTKVAEGVADAGLVYRTDVVGRADVRAIVPAGADDVVNHYPIAALSASKVPDVAAAFVSFVTGPDGQAALSDAGFGAP